MIIDVKALIADGYRRISNSYRHIARIDRPDWKDVLAKSMNTTADKLSTETSWEDHYRRVHSKDVLEVPQHVYKRIPGSSGDRCGYVERAK